MAKRATKPKSSSDQSNVLSKRADLCVEIARLELKVQDQMLEHRAAQLMGRSSADLLKLKKRLRQSLAKAS